MKSFKMYTARQIFDLLVLQHWSVKDLAKVLGVGAGNIYVVRHRISSALAKETKRLEKELERQAGLPQKPDLRE